MKGQSMIFVFLLVLIFSLVIGIAFAFFINLFHKTGNEVNEYKFIYELRERTKGMAYGERRRITINLPAGISRICFYDKQPLGENISANEFTPYLKALFNNTDKNVAVEKKDKTYLTFKIDKLRIKGAYIKCYGNKEIIHLTAESIGDGQFILK